MNCLECRWSKKPGRKGKERERGDKETRKRKGSRGTQGKTPGKHKGMTGI